MEKKQASFHVNSVLRALYRNIPLKYIRTKRERENRKMYTQRGVKCKLSTL